MTWKIRLIIVAGALMVTASVSWLLTKIRPVPAAISIFAQDTGASPSATNFIISPTLEPTPLVINRLPENDYLTLPELPLITNLKKFLFFLADLFGIRLPVKNSGLDVYTKPSGQRR